MLTLFFPASFWLVVAESREGHAQGGISQVLLSGTVVIRVGSVSSPYPSLLGVLTAPQR